jgi:hypothetical protein
MTVAAQRLLFSLNPLIAEAKRRMRRRRLLLSILVALVAAGVTIGVLMTRSPTAHYTAVSWTQGHSIQARYCHSPDNSGAFTAASADVSCQTAATVVRGLTTRCYVHGRCAVSGFRCASYWAGRFGQPLEDTHHALCSSGARRIVWDGG